MTDRSLPLSGVRVVDLCSFVAGPTAGRTLAELGAEVVRVDPIRGAVDGDRWPVDDHGASYYWAGLNQAKKSLTVDLRSDAGRALVVELITGPGADRGIVLDNAAHAPWLADEALRARRADLIHVHISGTADGSPAVDYTVNAGLGIPRMTGHTDSTRPVNHVLPAWDLLTGAQAALAVVAAVHRRTRTGEGAYVDLALADVATSAVASLGWIAEAEATGSPRPRQGNALFGSYGDDFATADGHAVMVVGLTPGQWAALVEVTDTGAVLAALQTYLNADFSREADRYAARDAIGAILRPWFGARTLSEVTASFTGTRVLWSPYRDLTDVVVDVARGDTVVQRVDHPRIGSMLSPRSPMRWSGRYADAAPAPVLGGDTGEVLSEWMQYDDTRIAELAADGVVGGPS